LPSGVKVIVGRNKEENSIISRFAGEIDLLMEVIGFGSPITLLKNSCDERDIKTAASVCVRYMCPYFVQLLLLARQDNMYKPMYMYRKPYGVL